MSKERLTRVEAKKVLDLAMQLRPVLTEYGSPRQVFMAVMTLMVSEIDLSKAMTKDACKAWMSQCVDALWVDPS